MAPWCSVRYLGRVRPKKNEKPIMKRFREEFRSTNCRLEIPTAVIIPGTERNVRAEAPCGSHSGGFNAEGLLLG